MTLFLAAGLIYFCWNQYLNVLMSIPDYDKLIDDNALKNGNYQHLPVDRLLGDEGVIAVLDEKRNVIYTSSNAFDGKVTAGELECITDYESDVYTECVPMYLPSGELNYLVTKNEYDSDGELVSDGFMVLDEKRNVINGQIIDGKKHYSKRELNFLVGKYNNSKEIFKYSFKDNKGEKKTVLMIASVWSMDSYNSNISKANRIWLLFIPFYFIATFGFIYVIGRKIQRPLEMLNQAVTGFSADKTLRLGEFEGPAEIVSIGESFDNMADLLHESESERIKLDEERQTLIADISHDLKTPITVISGYAKAIRDGKIPSDDVQHYLEAIDSKATALAELVNTFHEFSKVEHPGFTLECKKTDICEFLREYLAENYEDIQMAGFNLNVAIPEKKVFAYIDNKAMKRALDNILFNSLKHNRLGTVIYVEAVEENENIVIIIADNGTGIPSNKAEAIFEPFVVGDSSRGSDGSGLGLSISKKIITLHRGKIKLCIPPAHGFSTEFEITIPTT